jgi:hypothetical protein
VLQNRILCFQKGGFFKRVRDLQYKLFTVAIRYQKVLVALARQLTRGAANPEKVGGNRCGRFGIKRRRMQGYNSEVA